MQARLIKSQAILNFEKVEVNWSNVKLFCRLWMATNGCPVIYLLLFVKDLYIDDLLLIIIFINEQEREQ